MKIWHRQPAADSNSTPHPEPDRRRPRGAPSFADLECWGAFSNSSMIKSFHRACSTAGFAKARVYDLRHSSATEMCRRTGDPKATAEMLMHAPSSRMMDRYTIARVEPRLLAAGAFNRSAKTLNGWQYPAAVRRSSRAGNGKALRIEQVNAYAPVAQQDRASVS